MRESIPVNGCVAPDVTEVLVERNTERRDRIDCARYSVGAWANVLFVLPFCVLALSVCLWMTSRTPDQLHTPQSISPRPVYHVRLALNMTLRPLHQPRPPQNITLRQNITSQPVLQSGRRRRRQKRQGKCQQEDLCLTQECVHAASSLLAALNNKVDPCHDFYEYACGGWIQANIHKADANTLFYGINHNILPEYIDTKLSQLLKTGEGVPEELLQTKPYRDLFFFYQSCLDVADEQEADLKPVFDMLKSKAEFQVGRPFQPESWNLTRALLEMFRMNGAPLFDVIIDADIRNSSRFSIIITSPRRSGLVPALVRPFRRRSRGLPGLQQFLRERGQRVLFGGTSDEAAVLEMLVGRNANTKREAAFFEPGAAAGAAVGVGAGAAVVASAADDAVAEALHRNNSALTGNDNVYPVINIVPTRQVFTGEDAKQPDERHVDGEYVDGQHYNAKQHAEENVGDKNNGDNISMLLLPDKFSNITKATVQIYSATPVTTLGSTTIHSNSTQIPSTTPAPTLRSSDAHSLIQTPTSTPIPAQGLTTTNITTHSSNQMHTTTATIPAPIQRSATTHSPTQTTTTTPSTTTAHEPTQATTTSSSTTSTTSSSSHDQDATTTPPGETDMNIIESEDYSGLDDAVEDDQNFLVSRKEIYRMFKNNMEMKRTAAINKMMEEYLNINVTLDASDDLLTDTSDGSDELLSPTSDDLITLLSTSFLSVLVEIQPDEREEVLAQQHADLYNHYTVEQLQHEFPAVEWQYLLEELFQKQLTEEDNIYVYYPEYLANLCNLIHDLDPWMVHYGLLAVYIYDVLLETVSTADDTDRQSFCLQASKNAFGEVMSNMYLHHVGNSTINTIRTHATSMLELLREEVEESIKSASWLSGTDQAVALGKLHTLEAEMGGFDNHWNIAYVNKSHTEIRFQEDFSFLEAVQELYRVFRRELYRLYHIPIERGAFIWTFTVQPYVVNAFHMQSTNIIVLPEAFFQPPFYRADSPEYLNYGSAANSMAHEIFHGLDFTGVLYDARGHLTRPFSDAVKQHLNQTVQCYHNLLSSNFYEEVLIEDTNIAMEIDSSATLNENLADIAGIRHAYRAYQRWVDRHHTEARLPALSLNPSQLFFVSAAQPYCAVIPDLAKIFLMEMDEHLPNGMRINALMMNTPEFAQAFNCSVDSKMVAQETCHIF